MLSTIIILVIRDLTVSGGEADLVAGFMLAPGDYEPDMDVREKTTLSNYQELN